MKTIRLLSLSALGLVAVLAALYFVLPDNRFNITFPSASQPEAKPPSPPVLAATAAADQITISWQPVEGAASYEIWGRQGENPWQRLDDGSLTGSSTSFTHTGLYPGQTFQFIGRAVLSTGHMSAWSAYLSATTFDDSAAPALDATPAVGKIQLSWTAVPGADNYHLIVWKAGQEDWERIGDPITSTITAYTHTGLIPETTYHYRVRAVISGTEGDWSDSVSAAPTVPAAPTLTATAAVGQVDLTWTAVTDADNYHLVMWNDDLEDWERIGDPLTGTITSYTHSELVPDHIYSYNVRAVVDGIEGAWATAISAIPNAPAAPTLTATAAAGQITLSWDAVAAAESYHLIVWKAGQEGWERISDPLTAATTSYTHSSLAVDQIYYYRISAALKSVEGEWSNTISAVPATASVPGLVATVAGGNVELSWSAVTGAGSYHLIVWTDGQEDWERIGDPLSSSTISYTHSGPTAGVPQYYRVRAVVNGTNGAWSQRIDVTP